MNQLYHPEFTRILPIDIGREILKGNVLNSADVNGNKGKVSGFGG
jgi:hypothetical protein